MTNEELIQCAKAGDNEAFNRLFEQNEKFTHLIAHRWENCKIPYDELISLCWMGMLKAYRNFDVTKGVKFISYASRCAENEIRMSIRKKRQHARFNCQSLDVTYRKIDGPEEAEIEIPDNINQYEDLINHTLLSEVREYCKTLDHNKQVIFEELIIGDEIQPDTAKRLGVAQSWVSRLRRKVIKDIQKYARNQGVV